MTVIGHRALRLIQFCYEVLLHHDTKPYTQ